MKLNKKPFALLLTAAMALSLAGVAAVPLLLLLRLPPLLQVMPLPAPLRQLLPTMDRPM